MILTFDTSLDEMYVTLAEEKKSVLSKIVKSNKDKYHSAYLISVIIELLKEKSITMQDVTAVGVNIGPGSFTGVRVSVTVARIIAQALNIPVVGVSSLEIISLLNTSNKKVICLIDARKNMAYTAIYNVDGEEILAPQVMEAEKIIQTVSADDYFIIADSKTNIMLNNAGITSFDYQRESHDFGLHLSKLTRKYLKNFRHDLFDLSNLRPLYIQPPPVNMPKISQV